MDIPLWGSLSIMGVLLSIIGWVVVEVIRGNLVTGKHQDQVDAQHAAELEAERARHTSEMEAERARSAQWQEQWQEGQKVLAQQTTTLARMSNLAEVFEAFINSLPQPGGDNE